MEEVTDRVMKNENQMNNDIRKYSPLVETYIQNLKPDTDLGFVPAGDKYFLGQGGFRQGREPGVAVGHRQQGQEGLQRRRQFLFVRDAVSAGRLLADDFHRHEWIR